MTFQYPARVVRVVDGDTVILDVDLGFHLWLQNQSFRLLGLNAREKAETGGAEAKAHLTSLLPAGLSIRVTSVKVDKYGGRYDGEILFADGSSLNQQLLHDGWAAAWMGAGTKPVPPWPRKAT